MPEKRVEAPLEFLGTIPPVRKIISTGLNGAGFQLFKEQPLETPGSGFLRSSRATITMRRYPSAMSRPTDSCNVPAFTVLWFTPSSAASVIRPGLLPCQRPCRSPSPRTCATCSVTEEKRLLGMTVKWPGSSQVVEWTIPAATDISKPLKREFDVTEK